MITNPGRGSLRLFVSGMGSREKKDGVPFGNRSTGFVITFREGVGDRRQLIVHLAEASLFTGARNAPIRAGPVPPPRKRSPWKMPMPSTHFLLRGSEPAAALVSGDWTKAMPVIK